MKLGEFNEYRGIKGTIEFSKENNLHFGKLIIPDEHVSYEATSLVELEKEFKTAVDMHLEIEKGV